nr:MAG TPA: hypothetical protein [Caudoviricetes sp.]
MGHASKRTVVDTQAGSGSRPAEIAGPQLQGSDCRKIYSRATGSIDGRVGVRLGSLSASSAVAMHEGKNPAGRAF